MRGRDYSQADMAEIIGVSYQALQGYRKDGCPCRQGDGRQMIFNSADTIEWLRDRARKSAEAPEAAEERARLLRAQAEKAEIEVAQLRGEIVNVEDVKAEWAQMVSNWRGKIIELIPKAVDMCGLKRTEAAPRIKKLVYETLEELAHDRGTRARAKNRSRNPKTTA